jgi:hypothetical protein
MKNYRIKDIEEQLKAIEEEANTWTSQTFFNAIENIRDILKGIKHCNSVCDHCGECKHDILSVDDHICSAGDE